MKGAHRRRLVALRALGLGDFLTGLPALRALSRAFPEHRRLLATPRVLAPLVDASGCGFEVVDAHGLAPLSGACRDSDVAVNLHGRGPQSHQVLLDSAPGRLIAFEHPDVAPSAGLPQWRPGEHEVQRWCRLLQESGIPADAADLLLDLHDPRHGDLRGATVIHPGAASPARHWPAARWAAVVREELRRGRQVVVTGGPHERALAGVVGRLAGLPDRAVLAGRTDLLSLAGVVHHAGMVACSDTGVAHLATALGVPSVILFGPSVPAEWGPPEQDGRHRVLWKGSTGDPHGETVDPGLLQITVGEVLAALDPTSLLRAAR